MARNALGLVLCLLGTALITACDGGGGKGASEGAGPAPGQARYLPVSDGGESPPRAGAGPWKDFGAKGLGSLAGKIRLAGEEGSVDIDGRRGSLAIRGEDGSVQISGQGGIRIRGKGQAVDISQGSGIRIRLPGLSLDIGAPSRGGADDEDSARPSHPSVTGVH